jgi:hypothetical protein
MFSICVNRNAEFAVVGIANVAKQTVKFQGTLNGIPFTQSADYEKVRARIMRAVALNQKENNKELS